MSEVKTNDRRDHIRSRHPLVIHIVILIQTIVYWDFAFNRLHHTKQSQRSNRRFFA